MRKCIITGASGFVGANLTEKLIREGHEVHLLLRERYTSWRLEQFLPYVQLHIVNLLDRETLTKTIEAIHPDWIFHLAAYGAYSWQDDSAEAINTNYLSTVNLLEMSLKTGFDAFVNTGSSSEYGLKDHAPSEDEFIDPNSYYAATKAAATLFCRFTAQRYTCPIFNLRLYSVYGPYEEPRRLIPTIISKCLQGDFPPLASADIARDFIYAEDVVSAYLLLAESADVFPPGEVYNVGTGTQTTIKNVVEIAQDIFNLKKEPIWGSMPNRAWDTATWVADNSKLCSAGWKPIYEFRSGFEKTIDWFQQNPLLINRIYR
jgi:UDP-glucose 4-epimerase